MNIWAQLANSGLKVLDKMLSAENREKLYKLSISKKKQLALEIAEEYLRNDSFEDYLFRRVDRARSKSGGKLVKLATFNIDEFVKWVKRREKAVNRFFKYNN